MLIFNEDFFIIKHKVSFYFDKITSNEITYLKVKIDTKDKKIGKNDATVTLKTNGLRKFYLHEVDFEVIK